MLRCRCGMILVMLALLVVRLDSKLDDEDDAERGAEADVNDDKNEENDEDQNDNLDAFARSGVFTPTANPELLFTRTTKKRRPLECYVCAYKPKTTLKACLDPVIYRVHTMMCLSLEDKCFTSIISQGSNYESVIRGCRSDCLGNTDTTCCELDRCNNQTVMIPVMDPQPLSSAKASRCAQPNVLVFVTVLLVLQTVVKVTFV